MAKAFVLAYDGVIESPGVLREDDVEAGEVSFLGAYPVTQGGHSSRVLGGLGWHLDQNQRYTDIQAWIGWRDLSLLQNYTGFQSDLTVGDGTVQAHQSIQGGLKGSRTQALSRSFAYRLGGGVDVDGFEQGESTIDTLGEVREPLFDARGVTAHIGGWGGLHWAPTSALTVEPGLRLDAFAIGVQSEDEAGYEERLWAWAPVIAPRISANFKPSGRSRLSGSYGRGMRTPDARGIDVSGRAPMTLTDSMELGGQMALVSTLTIGISTFATLVSDELIFDHIEARFLTSGRTRRLGVDGHIAWAGEGGVHADFNLSLTDGRYVATGEAIPYAPRVLAVGTLGYGGPLGGALYFDGGLRGWSLGARPLPGGFESTPASVLDLTATLTKGPWRGALDVVNVFNRAYRDGEFFYASHWDPDGPVSERPVRHFTAGVPRTLRFSLERSFR